MATTRSVISWFPRDEQDHWTTDEWIEITSKAGQLTEDTDEWIVEVDGQTWDVWRGWGDDAHERLHRSPTGQYYLGTVRNRSWDISEWSVYFPPYIDRKRQNTDPLRAAPPQSLIHAGAVWPGINTIDLPYPENYSVMFTFARQSPMEFMRVVAAAWFLDRDQGGHEMTWRDCPMDIQEIARTIETSMRAACTCDVCADQMTRK